MKLISWNVNGIRACVQKGFLDFFHEADADIFCIQETKMQEGQLNLELEGYYQYWNYAVKKGYSGTAVFTKKEPLSVSYGIGIEEHDQEGRVITCEFEEFYFVTVYTPNSQNGLARLDYRMKWEDDFRTYLKKLEETKPVIVTGDMNVAHKEIDLKNPKTNRKNAGFKDAVTLLNYGFGKCQIYKAKERKLPVVLVKGGKEDHLKIQYEEGFTYVDTEGSDLSKVEEVTEIPDEVKAPVKKGDTVGRICYRISGKEIGSVNLIASTPVEKADFGDYLKKIWKKLL